MSVIESSGGLSYELAECNTALTWQVWLGSRRAAVSYAWLKPVHVDQILLLRLYTSQNQSLTKHGWNWREAQERAEGISMCLCQVRQYEPVHMDSFEPPLSRRYAFQQLELMEAGWDRRDAQRIVDTWLADEIKCALSAAYTS